MNNATYPQTFFDSAGGFMVWRTEQLSSDHKTAIYVQRGDHSMSFWLTDKEVDQLATLLREAHDTSYPLFADQS